MPPELAPLFLVFFWSGAVALACWLAILVLEALPSFREAARPPEDEEPEAAEPAAEPEPASGH